jgi:hypothetical protein
MMGYLGISEPLSDQNILNQECSTAGLEVVICCLVYPLVVWGIGQALFPFTANGSMVTSPDRKVIESLSIAQPFSKDECFWPRLSAASSDASASASSALVASNYALRDRVTRMLGPIVKYSSGPKAGQLAAPHIEAWFDRDRYQGQPHLVAQWADNHNELAQGWWRAALIFSRYSSTCGARTILKRSCRTCRATWSRPRRPDSIPIDGGECRISARSGGF